MEGKSFGDFITNLVVKQYEKLPKKGKPQNCEWTILAAIVMSMEKDTRYSDFNVLQQISVLYNL